MPPRSPARPALPLARLAHIYISAFVAPSLLFFAGTGALQIFRLPDKPAAPTLLVKLARVHKDDVFAPRPPRPEGAGGGHAHKHDGSSAPRPAPKPSVALLKWFFAAASVGMIATTLFGLWMGVRHVRQKGVVWTLFAAGAVIPALLALTT